MRQRPNKNPRAPKLSPACHPHQPGLPIESSDAPLYQKRKRATAQPHPRVLVLTDRGQGIGHDAQLLFLLAGAFGPVGLALAAPRAIKPITQGPMFLISAHPLLHQRLLSRPEAKRSWIENSMADRTQTPTPSAPAVRIPKTRGESHRASLPHPARRTPGGGP